MEETRDDCPANMRENAHGTGGLMSVACRVFHPPYRINKTKYSLSDSDVDISTGRIVDAIGIRIAKSG